MNVARSVASRCARSVARRVTNAGDASSTPGHTTANGQSTSLTIDEGDTLTIDAVITRDPAPWGANVVEYQLQFFEAGENEWSDVGAPQASSEFDLGAAELSDIGRHRIVVIDTVTSEIYALKPVNVMVLLPLPVNTLAPVVSGSTTVAETLTSDTGTWTGTGIVYSYQWKRGSTSVGINANMYTTVTADIGESITCEVTATNARGAVTQVSNAIGPIVAISGGIQFVGMASRSSSMASPNTLDLTALTGGIASAAIEGDLVIAVHSGASNTNRGLDITDGVTPYTLIGDSQFANSANDTMLESAYKFMGSTPDTSTTFTNAATSNSAIASQVFVFRGVNLTAPFDVTQKQLTANNTIIPIIDSITPITSGAVIVAAAACAYVGAATPLTGGTLPNGYFNQQAASIFSISLLSQYGPWLGGTFASQTLSIAIADSTSHSYATNIFALRPA